MKLLTTCFLALLLSARGDEILNITGMALRTNAPDGTPPTVSMIAFGHGEGDYFHYNANLDGIVFNYHQLSGSPYGLESFNLVNGHETNMFGTISLIYPQWVGTNDPPHSGYYLFGTMTPLSGYCTTNPATTNALYFGLGSHDQYGETHTWASTWLEEINNCENVWTMIHAPIETHIRMPIPQQIFEFHFESDHGEAFPNWTPPPRQPPRARWKEYLPPGTFPDYTLPTPNGFPLTNTWYRIYTNKPGFDIAFKTNWVLATAVQTDSTGEGQLNLTNWNFPSSGCFFLYERTNNPYVP